ncbi:hypothetical protein L3Q82_011305, partial [Scortum barcoo]
AGSRFTSTIMDLRESRVFAAPPPAKDGPRSGHRVREIQVTGAAELRCPADRASVRVGVGSSKGSVSEVTSSVSRRLEYILQTVRQHGVSDEDTMVRRFLQREAEQYHMDAEALSSHTRVVICSHRAYICVCVWGGCSMYNSVLPQVVVTFSDFEKMEQVCSVLLEKLDKSVCVGTPQFYHSADCLSQLRRRACVSAVENAQQKAQEVSQLLGQTLGPPLLVKEEETKEWRSEDVEEDGGRGQGAAALSRLPHTPTITASSRVSLSFSLRDRSRKNL